MTFFRHMDAELRHLIAIEDEKVMERREKEEAQRLKEEERRAEREKREEGRRAERERKEQIRLDEKREREEEKRRKEEKELAEQQRLEDEELEMREPREIPPDARPEHCHILGGSGSGKSSIIIDTFIDHFVEDSGLDGSVVIIDPKGTLVDTLSRFQFFR